jgi:hypothetical protein
MCGLFVRSRELGVWRPYVMPLLLLLVVVMPQSAGAWSGGGGNDIASGGRGSLPDRRLVARERAPPYPLAYGMPREEGIGVRGYLLSRLFVLVPLRRTRQIPQRWRLCFSFPASSLL